MEIDEVVVDGGELVITWTADGFVPDTAATHAHFYWGIYDAAQVGSNAADRAPWELTDDQPFVPGGELRLANRPVDADTVCVTVAIKRLPPAFVHDPEVRSRFTGEARLLSSLDHPHIVPVYDCVERDDLCLLVMEQLSGGSVWDRFVARGLDTAGACAVGLVTAVALEHAHGRGVLHRDIKPENLLFGADGSLLKVADFGTAKVLTGGRSMATVAGKVLGTPSYMAPEQARGEDATPATDVYALGSTLYRLLSGQLPFPPAASPIAALYQRVHEPPADLLGSAPHVPEALAEMVMRSLATEPADRFPTAAGGRGEGPGSTVRSDDVRRPATGQGRW